MSGRWLNSKDWLARQRNLIGIMTGTSVDGVDIVLSKFNFFSPDNFSFQLISHRNYDLPKKLKTQILKAINNQLKTKDIAQIHYELAKIYYQVIMKFAKDSKFDLKSIDAIGIHGQTVWHKIPNSKFGRNQVPISFQLGSIGFLAGLTGLPVVGDFRSKDIALGGEGAPLVPIFDYHFIRSEDEDRIALNIGGIANITYLPRNCPIEAVIAFDTGPGNTLIDTAMQKLFLKPYDKNGATAKKGKCIINLIDELMKNEFIHRKPPKSTGRELFSASLVSKLIEKAKKLNFKKEDIITTLSYFTAWSISENIHLFANPKSKIIVSGGGAKNNYLLEELKTLLPKAEIILSQKIGIPIKAKEALAIAFLAYLRLGNIDSNIPSVTGASERTSLGLIG